MNWCKIKDNSRLAYDKYVNTVPGGTETDCYYRNLYDFFDDNNIIVEVRSENYIREDSSIKRVWSFCIWIGDIKTSYGRIVNGDKYCTRSYAERIAFECAFEKLDKILYGKI